ncbi:MAG: aspartate aminotransferase family protein [Candidatus Latescibacterota bacterium]|nr:MAG: aspartate aminotransferase family protein [Candidatus Latescibacterota bacterium]
MTHLFWYPGYDIQLENMVRADNCHLYDSDGKKYIDLESGVWCTSVGHGNSRILRVLMEQSKRISHAGFVYSSRIVEDSAKEILSLVGFDGGRCVFLCSGSEAVEYGVRVAQTICERPLLMTMTDSYFGAYGSASKKEENEWFCFDWEGCTDCPVSKSCDEDCERWAAIPRDRIGGFLFEPGSSSGLVRFPPVKLIQSIVRTLKENDGLILANEVTTGVGRTGAWFGYQHYGISPDVVAMGKGIGNGYPVSVTAFAPGAIGRLPDEPVKYAQSHQNDPLGAAVAREVIRIVEEEGLIERSRNIGAVLADGLEGIRTRTCKIEEVRARGMMIALEMKDDAEGSFADRTQRELAHRGFVLARRPGLNVLRIDPPLTIEQGDIERFLETLEDVLVELG